MKIDALSVFFPCINEEGNIENTVKKAEEVLKKLNLKYEIIIVNDGSWDATGEIADRLAGGNPNIRVIHHSKNLGYGEALKSGFYNARFDKIVYTDGDGQFNFEEVIKFLEKIKDSDLVIGYRIKRQDSLIRRFFGKGWRLTLLAFFRMTLKDVDCGFKMVKKEVLEKISHLESSRGAMINAELAIKAKKAGFKIGQVGVTHYPRLSGRPTGASVQVIIKSYLDLIRLWWKLKSGKGLFVILLGILILASIFRFYRLSEYMTFLGDEGRDAIAIRDLLVNHHFPFIGPPTSVGNIYLGPLYYYMMAIPMAVFWLDPVAAVAMNAFLGVGTVALIYYLGKKLFSKSAGLIAAYLYAISPVTITYSRSSWNPNPAPFFALLSITSLYQARHSNNYKWLILTGFAAAAAIQMHYLALILLPVLILSWIRELLAKGKKYFWTGTFMGIVVFLLLMSPLLIFDLRHNFLNYKAISAFFLNSDSAIGLNLADTLSRVVPIYSHNLIARYMTAENSFLTPIVALLILIPFFKRPFSWSFWIINSWLLISILGLAFYRQNIYDHYLGFLNPVPYLLLGSLAILRVPFNFKKYWGAILLTLILVLTFLNLQRNPLLSAPQNQIGKTQKVAKFIISQSGNKDLNFALLAKNNYDSAYQFYLDIYGHKPKQVPFTITDQLFVVCEDDVCDPTHSSKHEVAAFGWSKVEWQQDIYGVKIYKLIPNPSGKP